MRGLILFAVCVVALGAACNEKSERKKGGGDSTTPYVPPSTYTPTTPTTLSGRTCTSKEIFGSDTRRIIINATHGNPQISQMQITNPDGTTQSFTLQPASKFLLMPKSDNYDVIPSSVYGTSTTTQGTGSSGGVLGSLFGGSNNYGHVTIAPSGNVYLRGVKITDSSSGTAKAESLNGKATCI